MLFNGGQFLLIVEAGVVRVDCLVITKVELQGHLSPRPLSNERMLTIYLNIVVCNSGQCEKKTWGNTKYIYLFRCENGILHEHQNVSNI